MARVSTACRRDPTLLDCGLTRARSRAPSHRRAGRRKPAFAAPRPEVSRFDEGSRNSKPTSKSPPDWGSVSPIDYHSSAFAEFSIHNVCEAPIRPSSNTTGVALESRGASDSKHVTDTRPATRSRCDSYPSEHNRSMKHSFVPPSTGAALSIALLVSSPAFGQDLSPVPEAERNAALSRIDPDDAVLVMVDFTDGLYPVVDTIDVDAMLNNAVAMTKIAESHDIPILVLGDEGGFYGDMHPAIKAKAGDDGPFERTTPSAWASGGFRAALEATGRTQVMIGGISTDNCTFLTSLDLLRAGYDVYVVTDIGGSDSAQAEQAALMRLRDAGAATANWIMLGSELLDTWDTPEGKALGQIYATHINGPNTSVYGNTINDASIGGES